MKSRLRTEQTSLIEDYLADTEIDFSDEDRESSAEEKGTGVNFFAQTSSLGENMSLDVFNYMTSFLPYDPDLIHLSQTCKALNTQVKETIRYKLERMSELQPSCLSACFSYFSEPIGIRKYFPYTFSFVTSALGAAAGAAISNYVFDGGNLSWPQNLIGSAIGAMIGSALGNCPGAFYAVKHTFVFEGIMCSGIIGSALGGGIMLAVIGRHEPVIVDVMLGCMFSLSGSFPANVSLEFGTLCRARKLI